MKQNELKVDTVLDYIDQPQLFIARDKFDTMYLCLCYDDDRYTGIRISAARLQDFENQKIDLLTLFLDPENNNEYFDILVEDSKLVFRQIEELCDSRLPDPGYYLTSHVHERITVKIPVKDKGIFASIAKRFGWIAI